VAAGAHSPLLRTPRIAALAAELRRHPLYDAVADPRALAVFMEHHVYAVWDFMSLLKALQRHLAPAMVPWLPPPNARHAHLINLLVLEEEADAALPGPMGCSSHFDAYCTAMGELGADTSPLQRFMACVRSDGIEAALAAGDAPAPSRAFMRFTFDLIACGKPHLLAAALAYGREDVLPGLYRRLLEVLRIAHVDAPGLSVYLERHIALDESNHGPMAMAVLEELCAGSPHRRDEARLAAEHSLAVRLAFWDGIHLAITI